jgi:hypothetical protein
MDPGACTEGTSETGRYGESRAAEAPPPGRAPGPGGVVYGAFGGGQSEPTQLS